jgi:hypothetical protein
MGTPSYLSIGGQLHLKLDGASRNESNFWLTIAAYVSACITNKAYAQQYIVRVNRMDAMMLTGLVNADGSTKEN